MIDVNADLALHLLALNTSNRSLRRDQVARIARDLVSGKWVFDGNPLVLDTGGNLVAGQHRCHALLEADKMRPGITMRSVVVTGADPNTVLTSNSGVATTSSDVLAITGYKNASALAAAARLHYAYTSGALGHARRRLGGGTKLTSQELIGYLEDHPGLEDAVIAARAITRTLLIPASAATVAYYVLAEKDTEFAMEFFQRIENMQFKGAEDPMALMVQRAQKEAVASNRGGMPPSAALYLVFRTWNAVRTGEKLERFLMVKKDGSPQTIPPIV